MSKYMITGIKGQLGTELSKLLDEKQLQYDGFDAKDLDITDRDWVSKKVNELKPEVIFHCAAYTAVDNAEDDGKDINWKVNVNGTKNVADAAAEVGATLVYISTDYVFDGTNEGQYNVDDATNPQNEYGLAKLAGELAVKSASENYYIIRTSWVFGEFGKNFVFTMQNLAESHDQLTVVNDQTGRPTWTRTLAEFMTYLVENTSDHGTYHLSNDNEATWFDFATEILKDTKTEVVPVDSSAFKQKAHRPEHSVMNLDKAKATGFKIPTWQQALAEFTSGLNK